MTRSIPTIASLRASGRRLDRRLTKVAHVLIAMQRGAALQLAHTRGGDQWALSDGRHVPASIAALVIANRNVAPAGDGLFPNTPQTFRWIEP